MQTRTYAVTGMTCGHCVAAVEREVAAVAGVAEATADLDSGQLRVTGDGVRDADIAAAVEEAGYTLAP